MTLDTDLLAQLNQSFNELDLNDALKNLGDYFNGRTVFSSSLGLEDQVITHAIFSQKLPIEVFTLDTGRVFPESYTLLHETQRKYGLPVQTYYPQTAAIEELVSERGINALYDSIDDRKACCQIRKLEPLNRALQGAEVWITGLRGEQSAFRSEMNIIEWDEGRQLIKFNPLLAWTTQDLWDFINTNDVPFNPLHEKGFPSIGCEPCTRAIKPGEDERAGRWWWEQVDKKECGLHFDNGKLQRKAG